MLGKLMKYDLKAINKFMFIIHGFLLLSSILGRIFITSRLNFQTEQLNEGMLALAVALFTLIFTAISCATYIIIAVRFYKNLFSDEGYLTLTLPVTRGQLLLSKTIASGIWCAIDVALIYISSFILIVTPQIGNMFADNKSEILNSLGISSMQELTGCMVLIVFVSLVGAMCSAVMIHGSVAFGQLFHGHPVLGSVVCYFILTTIVSVVATILMIVTGVLADYIAASQNTEFNYFTDYLLGVFKQSVVISLIMSVILYIATYILMKKKINLS